MKDDLYLSARRPDGQDDADPEIADALSKCCPKRAEDLRCSDKAICAGLQSVEPPAGLRERILSGGRACRKVSWFERFAWRGFRNSEFLAAAAIVLLLVVAFAFQMMRTEPAVRDWQTAAVLEVKKIEEGGGINSVVREFPAIKDWLNAQTCPAPDSLPEAVQELTIFGCSKMVWNNLPMGIVCFDLGEGKEVHLVTVERRYLPGSPPDKAAKDFKGPAYAVIDGYETASWSEKDVAMMLLGRVPRADLQKLFAAPGIASLPLHQKQHESVLHSAPSFAITARSH